jgi:hypothetical protein
MEGTGERHAPEYTIKVDRSRIPIYGIGLAGALAVLAAVIPWINVSFGPLAAGSKSGMDGDGVYVMLLGVALIIYTMARVVGTRVHWAVGSVLGLACWAWRSRRSCTSTS